MATAAKKLKLSQSVDSDENGGSDKGRVCPYGARCYRKNPQHLKDFSHPTQDGTTDDSSPSGSLTTDTTKLPPCKYGANCYRTNLLHFAEYSHPTKTNGSSVSTQDDSGDDTDICDSDDGDSNKTKNITKCDSLLLAKSYSKMSESERKDLIKKAVEAKQQLQKELKETKEKMAEKDRELKTLQEQVSKGLLLVDGEKEALEGKETKYFTLHAERAYKEGSANQIHFRLAESQFYRLLSGQYAQQYRVSKVEYVVNPGLVKDFSQAREDLKKERGEKLSYPVLAFHGTDQSVIPKICEGGFLVPGEKGFKHKTDTGWYGKGVYFSEYPAYSMGYIHGATSLMLCQVLPGKVFQCTKLIHGASLKSGYDSHTSPDKKELVVFNSHHILPSYIVHYTNATTEFKYAQSVTDNTTLALTDDDPLQKYTKAVMLPAKGSLFSKREFAISGKMVIPQKHLMSLIEKHGGKAGTAKRFDALITTPDDAEICTAKVQWALDHNLPVYTQDYIFDMIIHKGEIDDDADYFLCV